MKPRFASAIIFCSLCLLLASCGGKRTRTETVEIEGKHVSLTKLYDQLADSYEPWHDFYSSVSLGLKSPVSLTVSGKATMVRNESVHFSLRFIGMEFGQLYVDKDSVYAIDKLHKYFIAESLADVLRGYPMTIGDIQDFLLGQAFVPGKGTIQGKYASNLNFSPAEKAWTIQPAERREGVDWWCTASETMPPILASISFVLGANAKVDCVYSDAVQTTAGVAQNNLNAYAAVGAKNYAAAINWDLDGAKWDTGRRPSFKRPSGYKKITLGALLEALKKF